MRLAAVTLSVLAVVGVARFARASTCDDLVRAGRSMEASGDPDRALRAYNDAIGLDPTCHDAYLRLGAIRESRRDYREAERVYSLAIEHLPAARDAYVRRASVRLLLGREEEGLGELRLLGETDPTDDAGLHAALDALHRLDDWFAARDQIPARLGVWRRIAFLLEKGQDPRLADARAMVRALALVVGPSDPVTNANGARGLRPLVARAANR